MSTTPWTVEQVLALAPDSGSAKAGRDLATMRKWVSVARSEAAAWGECQGSGAQPYRTQVDLSEPAFKCNCPSRKFPCKHGLGLLLLLVEQPGSFKESTPPAWVVDWLASRAKRTKPAEPASADEGITPEAAEKKERAAAASKAKGEAQKAKRTAAGLADLETWLRDLTSNGLAAAQQQPPAYWERTAARLVDSQAPGAARLVRQMAGIPSSGEGWAERLLENLGKLHLLLEGFKRIDTLPAATQDDLRTLAGWTQSQEEILAGEGVRDRWMVLGKKVEDEDKLKVQSIWLLGVSSKQSALVLTFAHGKSPLDTSLIPGTMLDAEVAFFPGAYRQRALIKTRYGTPGPIDPREVQGETVEQAVASYAASLAVNPWIERFSMLLGGVTPYIGREAWLVRDGSGHSLPLSPRFQHGWQLLAISGGHPLNLFGEWNGEHLMPMSIPGERFISL